MLTDRSQAQIASMDFPTTKQECWELSLYREDRQPTFRADVIKSDAIRFYSCILN